MKIFAVILAYIKRLFERIKNEKLRISFLQALPFWIGSLLTGLIAVLYAKLFALAEEFSAYLFHLHLWLLFIVTPACFVLAWWLVKKFSKYAGGSGIPQVTAALELANPKYDDKVNSLLSLRVITVKIISSMVMVVGGGVIGREGPTIQIAGSVFRKINQWLPKTWPKISRRNMIMTGAAAGLAAAFNTPLGGIVFAVEELTKTHISYFKIAIFTAVIIAGLTAQYFLGPYLYLGYPDVRNLSSFIFIAVIFAAAITGIAGAAISKLILKIIQWRSSFTKTSYVLFFIISCGLLLASLAFFVDEKVLGSGKEVMTSLLFDADKTQRWYTPVLRTIGPLLSFTVGGSGGIFAPALSAGASIGAYLGNFIHETPTNINLLALAGMVGFLTGVTRSPFTSAILVLEMTDRHSVIFHLMLAGMVASLVSTLIDKHSFYDHLKVKYLQEIYKQEESGAVSNVITAV